MVMAVPAQITDCDEQSLWDDLVRQTKEALETNTDPNLLALELTTKLHSSPGVTLPSVELAHRFVAHFFWDNHSPAAWKFLHTASSLNLIPPLLLIALLSTRVVPSRKLYPAAYRLYMELLKRNAFMLESHINSPNYEKIMKSIDGVLQLSQVYSLKVCEPGVILVEFVFSAVWQLLEALLDDEGLLNHAPENKPRWLSRSHDMNIDGPDCFRENKTEQKEGLQRENTAMAIEIIAEFLQNKMTSRILSLVHRNMPSHWGFFIHQMQLFASNSSVLRNLKHITAETLLLLTENVQEVLSHECKTKSKLESNVVIPAGPQISFACQSFGDSWSSHWLPIDLILEDALAGGQVAAFSAIEIIAGLVKTLHAVNGTTWNNTFLGLWVAALRLVQRERDSKESPIPRFDTCMCMLLSITTLVVTQIIEEEEGELIEEAEHRPTYQGKDNQALGKRREELITSLQLLGDYEFLLTPPQPVLMEANQAAAKAIMLLSGNPVGSGDLEHMSMNDLPMKCSGNLRHLIVEACIARNLLDTSAYFWPGYVNACSNQIPSSVSNQEAGWSSLMKGSQLTPTLVNVLVATPASSLAETEKIYEIAINGSEEEKISAATILCGASLVRGWNVQEHIILFIIKLLAPDVPPNYSGAESHLISQAPIVNVLLIGISSVDCVQIFSLHGLLPLLSAGLMLICEVFGSCVPDYSLTLATGEKLSHHEVFSNAFTLMLRFWRFDLVPLKHVTRDVATPPFGSPFSPECLLLIRNCKLASFGRSAKDRQKLKRHSKNLYLSPEPVFMDSFPKLNFWYQQHQECIASICSGFVPGGSVHQIVDALISMMFRKLTNGAETSTPTTSGSSISSVSTLDDSSMKLKVPAWDILEAIPFVLDAALTACAYGRLSTRELATGLKDLADFLPASLVTITSYFSAEVTRGIWKPAFMNGIDWPSPAANLSFVEQQITQILAATGVDVPSLAVDGDSPATLPLPLAAFLSLSITYRLDKASQRILALIAPAINALASGCPWPCMPIVASLWIQKVKRWSEFLVFSASGTIFHNNRDAVVQLLKSCFTSTLGIGSACIYNNGGVSSLLGHGFVSQISGDISPVAPGILYLRVYRSIGDITFLTEEILSILMLSVKDIASSELPKGDVKKLKKTKHGIKFGQVSLARSMSRVKRAALLGASLVWISGGPKLVHSFIRETLPSWFLSANMLEQDGGESGTVVAMLRGYALAFFVMLSGAFSWGIDHSSITSKRGTKVLRLHLEFLTSALDRNSSLRCHCATWQAYVSGFVSLMVGCTPLWVQDVDVDLLKRLSRGLRRLNEHELALRLLEIGGLGVMGAAAEMIINFEHRF
ncbi:mediator of RNA polymerase II transcription subunit 33A-like [Gastrolobium bilobum]|uniref:mediator of RNA polymerase II transcription subunit 33A-like n=1 Tax=Gastrolobium bilobum TaxID=150636 RepID=UPI002AB248B8|nr:mediator of RNA polymerase II transcription subunit 33A-like [Gastrolobium bilobum]